MTKYTYHMSFHSFHRLCHWKTKWKKQWQYIFPFLFSFSLSLPLPFFSAIAFCLCYDRRDLHVNQTALAFPARNRSHSLITPSLPKESDFNSAMRLTMAFELTQGHKLEMDNVEGLKEGIRQQLLTRARNVQENVQHSHFMDGGGCQWKSWPNICADWHWCQSGCVAEPGRGSCMESQECQN